MKRLLMVMLTMTACGTEETPNPPYYPTAAPETCTTPGSTRCAGTWLQTCTNGYWTPSTNCAVDGAECTASGDGYACVMSNSCTEAQSGQSRCDGNVRQICSQHDWILAEDCDLTGATCVAGVCEPAGCNADQQDNRTCFGDLVMLCDGGFWLFDEECSAPDYCALTPGSGTAECVFDESTYSCNAAELGATKCDGDVLLECNGNLYGVKEDCAVTGDTCVEYFQGVARCDPVEPPVGMFESCTGTGQGNCDSPDLVCGEVTLLSDGGLCVIDCTTDSGQCDNMTIDDSATPGYCEPGNLDGSGAFSSGPFCFWLAERNGMCLFNDDGCVDTGATCQSITDGLNPECKVSCAGDEVGTQAATCAGQTCLRAPYVEIEQMDGVDRACTTVGSTTECSASYACTEVAIGDTTTGTMCARRAGLCGNEAPAAGAFSNQTEVSTFIDDDTHMCELLGTDQYCGADDAAGALNECVSTGFAFRYDPAIPCGGFDDFIGCFGLGECITFDGVNFECGVGIGICQRFCTASDGTDLSGTPCDTGTCVTPAYPVGPPAVEFDNATGDPVFCDANPGVCSAGFSCDSTTYSDAAVCTKLRKACSP